MTAAPVVLTIHERDITFEVCRRCARCCQIELTLPNASTRYRKFLRGVGLRLSPAPAEQRLDCCDMPHDVTVQLGPCGHLKSETVDGEAALLCGLYGDARRPQLCEEYNCVSWAKSLDRFTLDNEVLAAAQRARNRLRRTASPSAEV